MKTRSHLGHASYLWMSVIGAMAGSIAALFLGPFIQETTYTSEARLLFLPAVGAGLSLGDASTQYLNNQAAIITSEPVLSSVAETLQDVTERDIAERISASPIPLTDVLRVRSTGESPELAKAMLEAVLSSASPNIGSTQGIVTIEPPSLPDSPSGMSQLQIVLLGGLGGSAIGAVSALVRSRIDPHTKNPSRAETDDTGRGGGS